MSIEQCELPLPLPPLPADVPVLPARMINEYVYCPRLTYLEWVQGEWAESVDTVQGKHVHRRVDNGTGELPEAGSIPDDEQLHSRSVTLSSERLGLIAKMDLVEVEGGHGQPFLADAGAGPGRGAAAPRAAPLGRRGPRTRALSRAGARAAGVGRAR